MYLSLLTRRGTLLVALVLAVLAIAGTLAAALPTRPAAAFSAPTDKASCDAAGGSWAAGSQGAICNGVSLASFMTLEDQVRSYLYYRQLGSCVVSSDSNLADGLWFAGTAGDRIARDHAASGNWFGVGGTYGGGALKGVGGIKVQDSQQGQMDCNQTGLVTGALSLWDSWKPDEALCAMGMRSASDAEFNAGRCTNAQGATDQFQRGDTMTSSYQTAVKNRVYGGKSPAVTANPAWTDAGNYLLYRGTLLAVCVPTATVTSSAPAGSTNQDYHLRVPSRAADGSISWTTEYYTSNNNHPHSDGANIVVGPSLDPLTDVQSKTCGDLMNALNGADGKNNGLADKYAQWLFDNRTQLVAPTAKDPAAPNPDAVKSSCAIDSIGWLICPVLSAGAGLADAAYKFIANDFLKIDTGLVGPDTMTAWKAMQGIANVLFIPVFLWMIYLLMTGSGNTNRMAEFRRVFLRLIVMAILANVSFFICQIAVDVSNILGFSLKDTLEAIAKTIQASAPDTVHTGDDSTNIAGIVTTVLIVGSAVWINVGAVIVAVVGALISLLIIFFLLAMRKALIVLLVVVAPIAFVAYVLPNTQKLFDKWRKMFTDLLLVFPVIGLVYGACLVAHAILWNVAQGAGDNKTVMEVIAYLALVVPLIVSIPLLKNAIAAAGNIGGTIQGIGAKLRGGVTKGTQKAYDKSRLGQFKHYRQGVAERRLASIQAGTYKGKGGNFNPRNWASNANRGVNDISGRFGQQLATRGAAIEAKESEELDKNALAAIESARIGANPLSQAHLMQLAMGQDVKDASGRVIIKADDHTQRMAITKAIKAASVGEAHQLVDASPQMSAGARKTLASVLPGSSAAGKAAYLGGKTLGEIEQGTANTQRAMLAAVAGGKITAAALAAGDKDSVGALVDAVGTTPEGSVERQALTAAYAELNQPGSRLREGIVSGGDHDQALRRIAGLSGAAAGQPRPVGPIGSEVINPPNDLQIPRNR
ncbi:hypothetical protein [Microbacterium capsulatum]|uniref:TrbL/VirB6 plasmid conjugal transfer protein n=1 Tax=Microbacterium capsulatum TaxID=3041921 RepID=A0ABU0XGE2_9MICO|nr:hypothetical protein [Microbacterium sp. ASV81]MDQ4213739.1 hypothetical protein [Microbacterium sp. ASV81]